MNTQMLIQCVPNLSEGRRDDVVRAIVKTVSDESGVRLVDWSADADHNRMVVTFVGEPDAIKRAIFAMAEVAVAQIDLSQHRGVHPRLGALDVVPLVPLRDISMADCGQVARDIGRGLADRFKLPIFLYEYGNDDRRLLPQVRKQAFDSLFPDYGPTSPHPTAGATVVGARGPLIAYNVVLKTPDAAAARTIARELREGGIAGLKGVRALGLPLQSRGLSQVSTNITAPDTTGLSDVFGYVCRRATELGIDVVESEVIGALPGFSAFRQIADSIRAPELKPGQVLLDNWPA